MLDREEVVIKEWIKVEVESAPWEAKLLLKVQNKIENIQHGT